MMTVIAIISLVILLRIIAPVLSRRHWEEYDAAQLREADRVIRFDGRR